MAPAAPIPTGTGTIRLNWPVMLIGGSGEANEAAVSREVLGKVSRLPITVSILAQNEVSKLDKISTSCS
jgi:hypothetical protein